PGDWVSFPTGEDSRPDLDTVVARGDEGRLSALLVHTRHDKASYAVGGLDTRLTSCARLLKIDAATGGGVIEAPCEGSVTFEGYGVAVVTNASPGALEV